MIWQVWLKGRDPLVHIQTEWSLDDLADAQSIMDYEGALDEYRSELLRNRGRHR